MNTKKNVVVEFSVYPTDTAHFSEKIAKAVRVLEQCGLEYQVGPMSTCLRGEWDAVMSVVRSCHEVMAAESDRVITTVTIDERRQEQHGLKQRVELVSPSAAG